MVLKEDRLSALNLLADLCRLRVEEIELALASFVDQPYKRFRKQKPTGGFRWLHEPCTELKNVQEVLLHEFFYKWRVSDLLFGFNPCHSSRDGAKTHLLEHAVPRWTLKLDLKDAFSSVTSEVLEKMFYDMLSIFFDLNSEEEKKVHHELVSIILRLITHNGRMIQGAPTSPYLLNLVLSRIGLVKELIKICNDRVAPLTLSIYADDFIISSAKRKIPVKKFIKAIEKFGVFKVNPKKIRLNRCRHQAHVITGISLASGRYDEPKLTLPQKKLKIYRGKIHRAMMILKSGRLPNKEDDGMTIEQIMGYISRIKDVCSDSLPSGVRKVVMNFEVAWVKYKGENISQ